MTQVRECLVCVFCGDELQVGPPVFEEGETWSVGGDVHAFVRALALGVARAQESATVAHLAVCHPAVLDVMSDRPGFRV